MQLSFRFCNNFQYLWVPVTFTTATPWGIYIYKLLFEVMTMRSSTRVNLTSQWCRLLCRPIID